MYLSNNLAQATTKATAGQKSETLLLSQRLEDEKIIDELHYWGHLQKPDSHISYIDNCLNIFNIMVFQLLPGSIFIYYYVLDCYYVIGYSFVTNLNFERWPTIEMQSSTSCKKICFPESATSSHLLQPYWRGSSQRYSQCTLISHLTNYLG